MRKLRSCSLRLRVTQFPQSLRLDLLACARVAIVELFADLLERRRSVFMSMPKRPPRITHCLRAQRELRQLRVIRVVSPQRLHRAPDRSASVNDCSSMKSPRCESCHRRRSAFSIRIGSTARSSTLPLRTLSSGISMRHGQKPFQAWVQRPTLRRHLARDAIELRRWSRSPARECGWCSA